MVVMIKPQKRRYIHCLGCGEILTGKSSQKYCNLNCGNIHRTRVRYTEKYRSSSPYKFMRSLLSKKRGERKEYLSIEDLSEIYNKQKGLCAISGMQIDLKAKCQWMIFIFYVK